MREARLAQTRGFWVEMNKGRKELKEKFGIEIRCFLEGDPS